MLGLVNCLWCCSDDKEPPFGLERQRGIPCDLANWCFPHSITWLQDFPWDTGRAGLKLGFPTASPSLLALQGHVYGSCAKMSSLTVLHSSLEQNPLIRNQVFIYLLRFIAWFISERCRRKFSEARAPTNVKGTSAAGNICWTGPLRWALRSALLFVPQAASQKLAAEHTAGSTLSQSKHTEGYSSPKPPFGPCGKLKPFILLCSCFTIQKELFYGFYSMLTERQLNFLSQFLVYWMHHQSVKAIDYFNTVSPNPSSKENTAGF